MPAPHATIRWSFVPLLGLLCLALAACGGSAHAPATPRVTTPAATANTKGAAAPSDATPETLPYSFPAAWRNAPGLPLLQTADPSAYTFAPSDGRIGYACDVAGGHLYVTHDAGDTWQTLSTSAFSGCQSVFIDTHDASDIFAQTPVQDSGVTSGYDLWRSRDGGATWRKLGAVTATGLRPSWAQIAVLGSRLVGQVSIDQEGNLQNVLYSSSDGGMTWSPFAQSVANQGYTIFSFTLINSAIWINTVKMVGSAGMSALSWSTKGGSHAWARPLDDPLSSQPNPPPTWWRSLDGGATWSKVSLPGVAPSQFTSLMATRAYGGQGDYALTATSDAAPAGQTPVYDTVMWWSADGGATWKQLPDLRGAEYGYIIGAAAVALAPDGSVFASAQHIPQGYGDDAGVFRIQPADTASSWQPLVAGRTQVYRANVTSAGTRLWSIGAYESDSYLKFVNVP